MTEGFAFAPERLQVDRGATVRWVNDSDVDHTVTDYGDRTPEGSAYFASGGFETPGRDEYACLPHDSSGMTGTAVVGSVRVDQVRPTGTTRTDRYLSDAALTGV